MAGRMPEFADFTFAEKLYMGLANVERIFIAELDPVYCVVVFLLKSSIYIIYFNLKKYIFFKH